MGEPAVGAAVAGPAAAVAMARGAKTIKTAAPAATAGMAVAVETGDVEAMAERSRFSTRPAFPHLALLAPMGAARVAPLDQVVRAALQGAADCAAVTAMRMLKVIREAPGLRETTAPTAIQASRPS